MERSRQQRRAAARELAKEIIHNKPSEISTGDWVLWFLAAAMGIATMLAAQKLGTPGTAVALVLMFMFLLVPTSHISWIRTAPPNNKRRRIIACLAAEAVAVAAFGWWVWPESFKRTLSSGQQITMRNILASKPSSIEISVPIQDEEAYEYAQYFLMVFIKANWHVLGNNVNGVLESRPTVGIRIAYKQRAESLANVVADSLSRIDLKSEKALIPTDESTVNDQDLELIIGKNPKSLF